MGSVCARTTDAAYIAGTVPIPPRRRARRRRRYGAGVRLTHFRARMAEEFGPIRAAALSQDQVLAALGGRTVEQALEFGIDPRSVWRAVCEAHDVPPQRR